MSVIGPRPQLVRDMVFMTDEQRMRHTAKPGLSGLAQVNGRNAIAWEDKIKWDLKYIENVSIAEDIRVANGVPYTCLGCQIYHNCRFIICEDLIDQCFICDRAFNKVPGRV